MKVNHKRNAEELLEKFSAEILTHNMDDEVREAVVEEGITEFKNFLARYCDLHYGQFGSEFEVN